MGVVLLEVSGGVADVSYKSDTSVIHIDWDEVVANRDYAKGCLLSINWKLLPIKDEQRIKGMLAEIWDDDLDGDVPYLHADGHTGQLKA